MALLRYDEFSALAIASVKAFTPKTAANAERAIEFELLAGGEPIILRAWAPCNYRQVWAKLPGRYMERYRSDFYPKGARGEWVRIADHDSGWTEALRLFDYAARPSFEVDLLAIRAGRLPVRTEGKFSFVDEQADGHLAPLKDESWCLAGLDRWSALAVMFTAYCERADVVRASFYVRGERSRVRSVEITDPHAVRFIPRKGDRKKAREHPLNGEGVQTLLGRLDWRLLGIDLQKVGIHFI